MQVFLIRHPEPLIDPGICYGRLDVDCVDPSPLAGRLKPLLPPDAPVFSSPLRRARRLAEALDPRARLDGRLAEIDFGAWEGRPWDRIDRAALDAWAADALGFTPPGGEAVASLQARAGDFIDSIATLELPHAAVVTHAGVIRALLARCRRVPYPEWMRLSIAFGSLTVLDI